MLLHRLALKSLPANTLWRRLMLGYQMRASKAAVASCRCFLCFLALLALLPVAIHSLDCVSEAPDFAVFSEPSLSIAIPDQGYAAASSL